MSLSQHQWLEPKDLTGFVHFFELLAKVYDEEELTPNMLFNMDETRLSTAQDGQSEITAQRGK